MLGAVPVAEPPSDAKLSMPLSLHRIVVVVVSAVVESDMNAENLRRRYRREEHAVSDRPALHKTPGTAKGMTRYTNYGPL